MTKPMISVIIPIYNAEYTLEKCIDSVISQSFSDIEVILIEDGSSDKSPEIAEKYAQQDSRVKLIYGKNGGPADARNKGLKLAQGGYISFVDSDDWIAEKMYEELIELAQSNNNPNIIKAYHYKVTPNGTTPVISFHYPNKDNKKSILTTDLKDIMKTCSHALWSGLWKKSFLDEHRLLFAKDMANGSDIFFSWQAMIHSGAVLLVFKPYYYYNLLPTSSSVTRSINNKFLSLIKVFNCEKNFIIEQNKYEKYKYTYQARAYSYLSYGFKRALMIRGLKFHRYRELKKFFDKMRELTKDWDTDKMDFENTFEKQKFFIIRENNFIKYLIKTWALDIKIKAFWLYVIKNPN